MPPSVLDQSGTLFSGPASNLFQARQVPCAGPMSARFTNFKDELPTRILGSQVEEWPRWRVPMSWRMRITMSWISPMYRWPRRSVWQMNGGTQNSGWWGPWESSAQFRGTSVVYARHLRIDGTSAGVCGTLSQIATCAR